MESKFSPTEVMFNMTWRTLSYAAVPAMLPATSLDANGLIPRSFCPQIYDMVMKHVTDMQGEAQFAAWYWVVDQQSQEDVERGSVGWHPCFTLPANRRIVTRNVSPRIVANSESLRERRRSVSSPVILNNYSHSYSHDRRLSGDYALRMSSVQEESRDEGA